MMLCQTCIAQSQESVNTKTGVFRNIITFLGFLFSLAVTCAVFYFLGHLLSSIPETFHESPSQYILEEGDD